MFAILRPNREYLHRDGKIILFESPEEANEFINALIQYSVQRFQSEGRMMEAMSASMVIMREMNLVPVDFDIETVECGVIYCKDMRRPTS